MTVSGIIVAAGTGSRMGAGMNKVYMPLAGKCVLWHTIKAFCDSGAVDELVVVTGRDDIERCRKLLSEFDVKHSVTEGGATRQESVMCGLSVASGDYAAVHDGARALITTEMIANVISSANKYGAAAPGVQPKDTIKTVDSKGFIVGTIERNKAYQIQTPQVFKRSELIEAHRNAAANGFAATDDCMIMERYGVKIKITEGSYDNIKLTTPEDIYTAERILSERRGLK